MTTQSKTVLQPPGLIVPGTLRPGMTVSQPGIKVSQTGMIMSQQGMTPGVNAMGTQALLAPGVQRPGLISGVNNMGQMPGINVSQPGTAMGLTGTEN